MPFVVSQNDIPLMPCSEHRARHLLEAGEASIVNTAPLVIKLSIDSTEDIQDVVLCCHISGNFVEFVALRGSESLYYKFQKISKRSDCFGALSFVKKFIPVSSIVIGISGYNIYEIELQKSSVKRKHGSQLTSIMAYVLARDAHVCRVCGISDKNIRLENLIKGVFIPAGLISICSGCYKKMKENRLDRNEKLTYMKEEARAYMDTLGYVFEATKSVFLQEK